MTAEQLHRILYIAPFIKKYINGTLTNKEQEALQKWISESPENRALFNEVIQLNDIDKFNETYLSVDTASALSGLKNRYSFKEKPRQLYRWLPYVAASLFIAMVAIWKYQKPEPALVSKELKSSDILPGTNKATLTLNNGRSIHLSEAQKGIVVNEQNISYQDGKDQVVNLSSNITKDLVLTTPKGGTYSVTLSDGTKVWLNAQSTLKYPLRFDQKERVVELIGEAYFDVAKAKTKQGKNKRQVGWPFRVVSKNQRVEVLGTQFNITAYPNQKQMKTTLVEGSVRLAPVGKGKTSTVVLKPGQQGVVDHSSLNIDVKSVEVENYTAWKDGYFNFKNTPIVELMEQVSRWYDVEIAYSKGIPEETFSGKIKRSTSLKGLLEILQVSKIDVKLKDNKLIIN